MIIFIDKRRKNNDFKYILLIVSVCIQILYIGHSQRCKRSMCSTTSGETMKKPHYLLGDDTGYMILKVDSICKMIFYP